MHYLLMQDGISVFEIRKGLIKSKAALCSPLILNAIDWASKGKAVNDQRNMNEPLFLKRSICVEKENGVSGIF